MKKGELQVGEKERDHDLSAIRKEIATLVAEKCVDPATQRPYPVGIIEKAMAEAGFSVRPGKNAKSHVRSPCILIGLLNFLLGADGETQVSECIKLLQTDSKLPIQRARMRVRVAVPAADAERLKAKVLEGADTIERDALGSDEWEAVRVSPSLHLKQCSRTLPT